MLTLILIRIQIDHCIKYTRYALDLIFMINCVFHQRIHSVKLLPEVLEPASDILVKVIKIIMQLLHIWSHFIIFLPHDQ